MERFLLGISIIVIITFVIICLHGRKNKNTFKCDGCGQRYSLDTNKYYIYEDEMMCKYCYAALRAPYKVEARRDYK